MATSLPHRSAYHRECEPPQATPHRLAPWSPHNDRNAPHHPGLRSAGTGQALRTRPSVHGRCTVCAREGPDVKTGQRGASMWPSDATAPTSAKHPVARVALEPHSAFFRAGNQSVRSKHSTPAAVPMGGKVFE